MMYTWDLTLRPKFKERRGEVLKKKKRRRLKKKENREEKEAGGGESGKGKEK